MRITEGNSLNKQSHFTLSCSYLVLATRDFQSLSEDELLIIEVCDRDVTSTFRIFGIKMKFSDKIQTLGFPDYEPHKHETKYFKDRWSMEAWDEFLGVVRINKFPKTLWYEPGLWILPNTICYWIFKDPSVNFRTVSGVADLRAEFLELDEREPARTLWADAASETARLEHVPEAFVSKRLFPKFERAKNLLPIPRPSSTPKPRTSNELYELRLAQDATSAGSNSD
ncbi:hypothetical protein PHMEG_00036038 [Phytophthora megakarya]|uniref:Uncharacterized protein n=1 Tax=Phytophthora megakarya TaxID=4795 RepID=A0A225UP08_9STRA|nr:hypothetical protein PHMEG_00036038 [Phytophthora megakarya]